ncbi:hypothetical protein GIB67_019479 [Kingdonia uniflora]|uniref:Protein DETOXIFICATION n=1 Tax=Kingdonia uniflora TaxID=39325 RepID=A0A7J7N014_9MAGN|nr:hypothetical protein GIB67_019479 [Kingdonia uniflora]
MNINSLSHLPIQNPNNITRFSTTILRHYSHSHLRFTLNLSSSPTIRSRFNTNCITPVNQDLVIDNLNSITSSDDDVAEEIVSTSIKIVSNEEFRANESIWGQIKEIVVFAGPATGLWICGPLMSLIDTAVIGQGSSMELAALGPATVVCDYLSYVFMFLSIATSNMVATSLASEDQNEVQHKISILLFVGFVCGVGMLLLTKFFGAQILTAFTGPKNLQIVPAANTYVQIVAGFMMIDALNKKGFNAFAVSIPSPKELLQIFELAAPVFITMISKVAFYSLLTYFATSMGTVTIAAHQVMIQVYCMCTVWGEPLSQTAQSFMPELIYGANRSLTKARRLLKSLVIIGAISGSILGIVGTSVPWSFPLLFTADNEIIGEMHKVLLPYFIALVVTPSTHSLEGTLLAGRDLNFLSLSMSGCFSLGGLLVLLVSSRGFGLPGCWWALVGFQWARFLLALKRLTSPDGLLYSEEFSRRHFQKLKTAE